MYRLLVLTDGDAQLEAIQWALEGEGLSYRLATEPDLNGIAREEGDEAPDAVLLDIASLGNEKAGLLSSRCHGLQILVLAVVAKEQLASYDPSLNLDDFIVQPFHPAELVTRLDRARARVAAPEGNQVIRASDLRIDLERYEVSVSGKRVLLTYKEYQLLVLLASSPGKVFTRDNLLNQVWGYDYFGGTRTVDVHVRRLRSKTEDADHSFIETIRNVGYRFKASP